MAIAEKVNTCAVGTPTCHISPPTLLSSMSFLPFSPLSPLCLSSLESVFSTGVFLSWGSVGVRWTGSQSLKAGGVGREENRGESHSGETVLLLRPLSLALWKYVEVSNILREIYLSR